MGSARERWKPLVEALEGSSMSTAVFAQQAGVNRNTLAWWRWKLKGEERSRRRPPFTELVVAPSPPPVRLHLRRGDAFLDIDETTDMTIVRRLLEALC